MNLIAINLWGVWGLLLVMFLVALFCGVFRVVFTRGDTKWGWTLLVVGLIGCAVDVLLLSSLRLD